MWTLVWEQSLIPKVKADLTLSTPAAPPPKARLHFLKFWVQGGNQTILTHGMFQVGLAKLLAKTVEVKGIVSAWLCCAQKPTRIVRSL